MTEANRAGKRRSSVLSPFSTARCSVSNRGTSSCDNSGGRVSHPWYSSGVGGYAGDDPNLRSPITMLGDARPFQAVQDSVGAFLFEGVDPADKHPYIE